MNWWMEPIFFAFSIFDYEQHIIKKRPNQFAEIRNTKVEKKGGKMFAPKRKICIRQQINNWIHLNSIKMNDLKWEFSCTNKQKVGGGVEREREERREGNILTFCKVKTENVFPQHQWVVYGVCVCVGNWQMFVGVFFAIKSTDCYLRINEFRLLIPLTMQKMKRSFYFVFRVHIFWISDNIIL